MKKVKVKSNSIRSRIHVLGDIQLSFDDQGIAEMPEHLVPALAPYMRARPGRFSILEEEKPAKAEAPKPEEKKEEKPSKLEEEEAPKAEMPKDEDAASEEPNEDKNSNKKSKKGSSSKKK